LKRSKYTVAGLAVIAALTAVIYYPALFNGFVSDDGFQILANPWIKSVGFIPEFFGHSVAGLPGHTLQQATYRPLMYTAFTFEYALFGLNPAPWHLVNITVHALNGLLVFFISASLLEVFGGGRGGKAGGDDEGRLSPLVLWLTSLTAGALFISHPAASEPVSWVSALPELSFTFLVLLAFYFHINLSGGGKKTSIARYAGAPLFLLGLLFKETAAALPLFIFIYDVLSKRRSGAVVKSLFDKKSLLLYGAYVAAFLLYMALRISALGHLTPRSSINSYLGPGGLLLNAAAGFYKALVLLFWPMGSTAYPFQIFNALATPFEARAIVALVFTAVFFIALFVFRKKLHPIVLMTAALMVLPVLPALYTPVITRFDFAPRYVYLSTTGYALFTAFFLRWLFQRRVFRDKATPQNLGVALSWVLITLCAFSASARSREWVDNMTLARAALRGSADNYYALYQIGNAEEGRGAHDEAIIYYKRAISVIEGQEHQDLQTLRDSLMGLGAADAATGRATEAVAAYEALLQFYPAYAPANYRLAYLYQGRGSCERALSYYRRALVNYSEAMHKRNTLLNMGNCYARLGLNERALESYSEALTFVPGDAVVINNIRTLKRRISRPVMRLQKP